MVIIANGVLCSFLEFGELLFWGQVVGVLPINAFISLLSYSYNVIYYPSLSTNPALLLGTDLIFMPILTPPYLLRSLCIISFLEAMQHTYNCLVDQLSKEQVESMVESLIETGMLVLVERNGSFFYKTSHKLRDKYRRHPQVDCRRVGFNKKVLVHHILWRYQNNFELVGGIRLIHISHLDVDPTVLNLRKETKEVNESRKYCHLFGWYMPNSNGVVLCPHGHSNMGFCTGPWPVRPPPPVVIDLGDSSDDEDEDDDHGHDHSSDMGDDDDAGDSSQPPQRLIVTTTQPTRVPVVDDDDIEVGVAIINTTSTRVYRYDPNTRTFTKE